ncbi:MAG: hypothetical protein HQ567_14930 [Candidatus Nealsonbacteria bacterium]|nr:hypothetical protein [Candidatus Nealsonbacteria bacterium]
MAAARNSDRRWFQFSLSSLFWLTTLLALVFGAAQVFGWDAIVLSVAIPVAFLGGLVLFMLLLAGPLLVVVLSDFLKTTVGKVAPICGIGVFLLLALPMLAVLIMGRSIGHVVLDLIAIFSLFSGVLVWWGVQSLILWWMMRTVRSADTGAKLRRHALPESIGLAIEDQDPADAWSFPAEPDP